MSFSDFCERIFLPISARMNIPSSSFFKLEGGKAEMLSLHCVVLAFQLSPQFFKVALMYAGEFGFWRVDYLTRIHLRNLCFDRV